MAGLTAAGRTRQAQREHVLALLRQGRSGAAAAREAGVNHKTALKWGQAAGVIPTAAQAALERERVVLEAARTARSVAELERRTGIRHATVAQILDAHGVAVGRKNPATPADVRVAAVERVAAGARLSHVARDVGVASATMTRWVRDAGLELGYRPAARAAALRDDVGTRDWLTSEAGAWAVGLILTDGTLTQPRRNVTKVIVRLARRDRDGVVAFARAFGLGEDSVRDVEAVTRGKTYPASMVSFGSVRLGFLTDELGIPAGKAKTTQARLPQTLLDNRHAWRGIFDGDGGLAVTGPGVNVNLRNYSADLHDQLAALCTRRGLRPPRLREHGTRSYLSNEDAVALVEWLYPGAEFTIARKSQRALKAAAARRAYTAGRAARATS